MLETGEAYDSSKWTCGFGINSDKPKTECLNGFTIVLVSEFNHVCIDMSFKATWNKLAQSY